MLGHSPFYHEQIKKVTAAFGTLFNDIQVIRKVGNKTQTIRVPLSYASKDKAYDRRTQDADLNYNMSKVFPRMAFILSAIEYDPSRKLQQSHYTMTAGTTQGSGRMLYQPAPYNLTYSLWIGSTSLEDGFQIVEQILPYFNPEYSVKAKDVPALNLTRDIPIILQSTSFTDNTPDSDHSEFRILEWELTFTVKSHFYPAINDNVKLIKNVNQPMYFDATATTEDVNVNSIVNPQTAAKTDSHTIVDTITER